MQNKPEKTKSITQKVVKELTEFVKPTYGPNNNTIMQRFAGEVITLDDGVSAASSFKGESESEQMIVDYVTEGMRKTSNRVKDATTTTLLMIDGIINPEVEHETIDEIKQGAEEAKEQLRGNKKVITTREELQLVAKTAYNNPIEAECIAMLVEEVGKHGSVDVIVGDSLKTEYKVVDGIEFDKGFISPYMATNENQNEAVVESAHILVTSKKIKDHNDLTPLWAKLKPKEVKQLVIVAEDCEEDAMITIVKNNLKRNFHTVVITPPHRADRKENFLKDLCAITGATFIGEETELKDVELNQLGFAERLTSYRDNTKIVGCKKDEEHIARRVVYYDSEDNLENRKNKAILLGGVGVVKLGANTDSEIKQMLPKMRNAVYSTMEAYKTGVVRGKGLELSEVKTSSKILNYTLSIPFKTLQENDKENKVSKLSEDVVDSVEMLCAAIDSAVSISAGLLSSKGMIVDEDDYKR